MLSLGRSMRCTGCSWPLPARGLHDTSCKSQNPGDLLKQSRPACLLVTRGMVLGTSMAACKGTPCWRANILVSCWSKAGLCGGDGGARRRCTFEDGGLDWGRVQSTSFLYVVAAVYMLCSTDALALGLSVGIVSM